MATSSPTIRTALLAASAISLHAAAPSLTFSRDVWPILEKRCVTCHQPGEIAPMPLTSYKQVRPWAAAIREATMSRTMPPWHAAPGSAHAFRNDRSLSKTEIETIAQWVDAGAPEGDPLPEYVPTVRESGWKLGKPDIVIQVPGFQVPAAGVVPYSFLIVPKHFDRDTWVEAAEFRVDKRTVIHHINAFVRREEARWRARIRAQAIAARL
jgi:hypothetical protein